MEEVKAIHEKVDVIEDKIQDVRMKFNLVMAAQSQRVGRS